MELLQSEACTTPLDLLHWLTHANSSAFCDEILSDAPGALMLSVFSYLKLFLINVGLESIVYLPLLIFLCRKSASRVGVAVVLANAITHPALCYFWPGVFKSVGLSFGWMVLILELLIPVIEGLVISKILGIRFARAYWISALANLLSWSSANWI